jgi:hypothetical protein
MATGVQYPNVIDLVSHDPKTDVVTLSMVEERPWDGSNERILQLQTKIHNYVGFALDGQFAKVYPSYVGKPLTIALRCCSAPDETTSKFFAEMALRVEPYKIALVVRLLQ